MSLEGLVQITWASLQTSTWTWKSLKSTWNTILYPFDFQMWHISKWNRIFNERGIWLYPLGTNWMMKMTFGWTEILSKKSTTISTKSIQIFPETSENATRTSHLPEHEMRSAYKPSVANKRHALRTPCGFLSK